MDSLIQLVCQADLCGSAVATGVAWGLYTTPGIESDPTSTKLRFIQSENEDQVGGLYESGLKWRTHLYCYPMPRTTSSSGATSASCNADGSIPPQVLMQRCDCL